VSSVSSGDGSSPRVGWLVGSRRLWRPGAFVAFFAAIGFGPLVAGVSTVTLTQFEFILCLSMVVIGLNVVMGFAGQLSLGPGAIFGVAGYAAALVAAHAVAGGGLPIMVAAGIVAACVAGVVIGVPALRVGGFYLGMTTLLLAAFVPLVATNWNFAGSTGGIELIAISSFVQQPSGTALYLLIVGVVFVLSVLAWSTRHSRIGRRFSALRSSEELAASLGVSSYQTKLLAFVLSAVPAGLGGAFLVFSHQTISPGSINATLSVYILAGAVIGGLGTIVGPVVGGAIVFGLIQFLGGFAEYEGIIFGCLLILVVELAPEGLMGVRGRIGEAATRLFARRRSILPPALRGRLMGAPHRRAAFEHGTAGTDILSPGPFDELPSPLHAGLHQPGLARSASIRGSTPVSLEPERPAGPAGGSALEVRGLSRSFGGVQAVDGVDLTVRPGHLSALIGPNGSGKTTIINLVTGFYRPDAGTVTIGGEHLERRSAAWIAGAGVARTFQAPKLMLEDSVLENVMVASDKRIRCSDAESVLRIGRGRSATRVSASSATAALAELGIARYASEVAGEVPHGIQRLIEMARAVAVRPRFLFLDEPAAGLTPAEIAVLVAAIRSLTAAGVGVLLVEHNVRVVLDLAEEVTVLHQGLKIASGTPEIVRTDPEVIRVFLGRSADVPERTTR
jgi:ABC-type branched-subunit amino acid transport system ATPase component/ABC-type branched-subunit amino acid transport system permease subunit